MFLTESHAKLYENGEAYRSANGTEGGIFYSCYCAKCKHDSEDDPCDVIGRSLAFDIHDDDYPVEWIHDENGQPTCTAFETPDGRGVNTSHRCTRAIDMFPDSELTNG